MKVYSHDRDPYYFVTLLSTLSWPNLNKNTFKEETITDEHENAYRNWVIQTSKFQLILEGNCNSWSYSKQNEITQEQGSECEDIKTQINKSPNSDALCESKNIRARMV